MLASQRSVVTVEEIVDELAPQPGAVVLPSWTVELRGATCPGGAHPSYALGYSARDNDFYVAWDAISRDRERFQPWLESEVWRAARPAWPARGPARARRRAHGARAGGYTADEMMTDLRRACPARRHDLLRRDRAAQRGGQPGPGDARARAWC